MTGVVLYVTGATGFVGGAVVDAVLRSSAFASIRAGARGSHALTLRGIAIESLDLAIDGPQLRTGVDTVLHLAGEKRDESRMWAVNRDGTRRLIEAAAKAGARRFVQLSSVGVYGAAKHSGLIDESFAHAPNSIYEASKDAGERIVRDLCPQLGLEWAIVQPSNVLGVVPGTMYPLLGLIRALYRGRFVRFGGRCAWVNYVAIEDVADAIVAAVLSPLNGRTWIVNTPAPLDDVVAWVAQELAIAVPVRRLPLALGWSAAHLAVLANRFTGRAMPFDLQRFRELTNSTIYEGSAITRDTGFAYPNGVNLLVRTLARRYRDEALL